MFPQLSADPKLAQINETRNLTELHQRGLVLGLNLKRGKSNIRERSKMRIHSVVKRGVKTREGRGFSKAELRDAGLSVNEALKQGIPIDPRRSTKHEENVKLLKAYINQTGLEAPAEEKKVRTAGVNVEEIEGIGSAYAEKLVEAGIRTTDDLLEAGRTRKERGDLAKKTEISRKLILEWVNLADLFRIKGVGEEYSDLLEEAGVDTVVELAKRDADNLYSKMLEVNDKKKLVRRPPTLEQVQQWIEEAKTLPRKVEY
jgi:ribosomal protein L13E